MKYFSWVCFWLLSLATVLHIFSASIWKILGA